jgi:hypothetical protein
MESLYFSTNTTTLLAPHHGMLVSLSSPHPSDAGVAGVSGSVSLSTGNFTQHTTT